MHTLSEMCVQLTNACPMRCLHCSTRAGRPYPDELTPVEHARLISDFAAIGGRIIEFSGGEPLVHPALDSLIRVASDSGLEVRLYSSGVIGFANGMATPPQAYRWQQLKEEGLQKVFFNLQGDAPAVHEHVSRLPGSFDAVTRCIGAAKSAGLFVGIHFVPMHTNFQRIRETVRLSAELGADEFAVLRFVSQGRGADHHETLALGQDDFFRLLAEVTRLKRETSTIQVRVGCPFNYRFLAEPEGPIPSCKAGDSVCHVRPNGDVVPCSGFQQGLAVLGNVRTSSIVELWRNGFAWTRFRATRAEGPTPGSIEFVERTGEACLAQLAIANRRAGGEIMSTVVRQRGSGSLGQRETARLPTPEASL
jgi:AdoMet-dependent heme synthase